MILKPYKNEKLALITGANIVMGRDVAIELAKIA